MYQKVLYLIYFWQFRLNFITFSQTGEDIIIRQFIPEDNGSYIDIGSGDPIIENNTFKLYQRGWSGILIDPLVTNHLKNIKFRPRDKSILGICGDNMGEQVFNETIPYQFSYVSARNLQLSIEENRYVITKSYNVKQINLKSLNMEVLPTEPFLLSIDVEGFEVAVLNGIEWTKFQPRIILIEQHLEQNVESDFFSAIMKTEVGKNLTANNYKCVAYTGLTAVWINKIYLDLRSKL